MILTCPSCATRYTVADGAIPPAGRQVRCASCKHRWHQDPDTDVATDGVETGDFPTLDAASHPASDPAEQPDPAFGTTHAHPDTPPAPDDYREDPDANPLPSPQVLTPATSTLPTVDFSSDVHARSDQEEDTAARRFAATMPEQHESAAAPGTDYAPVYEQVSDGAAEPAYDQQGADDVRSTESVRQERSYGFSDDVDDHAEPRSRLPMILLGAVLLIAAIAAALWFLAPTEFRQRLGLADQTTETPLLLQVEQHSRQQLASGNQLLEVSGRVINPTDSAQQVPPLQAQLRSLEQKVVYSWVIPPPARILAPGGSATFNSAELNIPAGAACLDVSFGDLKQQQPCRTGDAARAG